VTPVLRDAIKGVMDGHRRRLEIARNLAVIDRLERDAVRIIDGPGGRLYEMHGERLLTVVNAQPRRTRMLHSQYVATIAREDAEDYFGWTRA
jgi:hypothetical protein